MGPATGNVLRVAMVLGGNAPFVLFDDAVLAKLCNGDRSYIADNHCPIRTRKWNARVGSQSLSATTWSAWTAGSCPTRKRRSQD